MEQQSYYQPADRRLWQSGRVDGTLPEEMRWHQVMQFMSSERLKDDLDQQAVFWGFCCDEGVRRNKGRVGAKDGPEAIRMAMKNLPLPEGSPNFQPWDLGDVICPGGDMEGAQEICSQLIAQVIRHNGFPVVLGGGHELSFAHYTGLASGFSSQRRIGLINIDAHFDLRDLLSGTNQGHSGSGFYQVYQSCKQHERPFDYMCLGIQRIGNTQALFNRADRLGVQYSYAEQLQEKESIHRIKQQIWEFSRRVDAVYLSIDMDAFSAAYAPGVSAAAYNGLIPDHWFLQILDLLLGLPNLCSMDVVEVNPLYDRDAATARLAAYFIFRAAAFLQDRRNGF